MPFPPQLSRLASFCASGNKREFLTTAQISQKLIDFGSIKRPMSLQRLGMILQKQGFCPKRVGASRGWLVYQSSMEEVKINKIRYAKAENQPDNQPTFF